MMQQKNSNLPWKDRELITQWQRSLDIVKTNGSHVFTELFEFSEPQQGPLNGAIISIKDLFQVAGYKSQAGSVFLDATLAEQDATAVSLLRKAGASFLGHTNMTELAYSGVGLNPHYGTPNNPLYADRIAGGSTSGGAVSVALGSVDAALGTDTGGSLRIPAAFCGLTGFKPSQQSVSRVGSLPLSHSLDSVGPIARTVAECELLWQVLSEQLHSTPSLALNKMKLVVPLNFGFDHLDNAVEKGFEQVILCLQQAGVEVERRIVPCLEDYKRIPVWQFSAVESQAFYGHKYDLESVNIDPRVKSRIARAKTVTKDEYQATCEQRNTWIQRLLKEEPNVVFLMPTVALCAPKQADLAEDKEYDRINLLCLRNTSLANVMNGCSISLPYCYAGEQIGVMLTAENGKDSQILAFAKHIEGVLKDL